MVLKRGREKEEEEEGQAILRRYNCASPEKRKGRRGRSKINEGNITSYRCKREEEKEGEEEEKRKGRRRAEPTQCEWKLFPFPSFPRSLYVHDERKRKQKKKKIKRMRRRAERRRRKRKRQRSYKMYIRFLKIDFNRFYLFYCYESYNVNTFRTIKFILSSLN